MTDIKFDLRDIAVVPAIISTVNSRSACRPTYDNRFLPLMAAPMDTVVCDKNIKKYIDEGIIPCVPRSPRVIHKDDGISFQAFGLAEIEYDLYSEDKNLTAFYNYSKILIDIANGHMQRLIDALVAIKTNYPHIEVMVGNVAHPLTYKNLAMAGADYVRISIGTGAGCTTAANVAINYPMGSLISECKEIKDKNDYAAKIVADGGMQGYDDIIKALALGADYVMLGSMLNKTMQSAGYNYLWGKKVPFRIAKYLWKWGLPVKKKYRGMSTKAVQRGWGKTQLVTAEGITKYQKVEYSLSQWVENFQDYLRSNMSYCGVTTLDEFIGKVEWVFISDNAFRRFHK